MIVDTKTLEDLIKTFLVRICSSRCILKLSWKLYQRQFRIHKGERWKIENISTESTSHQSCISFTPIFICIKKLKFLLGTFLHLSPFVNSQSVNQINHKIFCLTFVLKTANWILRLWWRPEWPAILSVYVKTN